MHSIIELFFMSFIHFHLYRNWNIRFLLHKRVPFNAHPRVPNSSQACYHNTTMTTQIPCTKLDSGHIYWWVRVRTPEIRKSEYLLPSIYLSHDQTNRQAKYKKDIHHVWSLPESCIRQCLTRETNAHLQQLTWLKNADTTR